MTVPPEYPPADPPAYPIDIVIIGASHAGLSCAEKLRNLGFAGRIMVLERDAGLPLQRPPLSKTYLMADPAEGDAGFALRKTGWFSTFDISFRPGCAVAGLDRGNRRLALADGQTLSYEHLVLATGAQAKPLPGQPDGAGNVHVLRTADDARRLRAGLPGVNKTGSADSAVVIGGGYIGLEAAASMRSCKIQVHLVELAPRLLARVASPALSAYCAGLHRQCGVQLHLGKGVDRFSTDPQGDVSAVHLADGTVLDTQLVLAGIGIVPDTVLARTAGLGIDDGIVVDAAYATPDPHISAIGDVARAPLINPFRVESIHHAQYSAAVVAARLTGTPPPPREAWWFWSDQYDVKFQMAGLVPPPADTVTALTRPGRRGGSLSVWSYDRGRLAAIEAANDPQAYMIGKKCLDAGINPDPADIANPDVMLKQLLG